MNTVKKRFTVTDFLVYLLITMIGISAMAFVGYFLYSAIF